MQNAEDGPVWEAKSESDQQHELAVPGEPSAREKCAHVHVQQAFSHGLEAPNGAPDSVPPFSLAHLTARATLNHRILSLDGPAYEGRVRGHQCLENQNHLVPPLAAANADDVQKNAEKSAALLAAASST